MSDDWEVVFSYWSQPPSKTEQDKCDNAEIAIRKAINSSSYLTSFTYIIEPQGSYRNRTNVRLESDVDICVKCTNTFYYDLPDGMSIADFSDISSSKNTYSEFKNQIHLTLNEYFGSNSVSRGNKAFDVHHNTYRVDADVLPAFEYRDYSTDGSFRKGIAFIPDNGKIIQNWPDQNYDNGVEKNTATGRRFKAIVRVLKNLRNKMANEGIKSASDTPSFLIESLVFNVPNNIFNNDTYVEDTRWTLAHIFNSTLNTSDCKEWVEVNDIKYLFHISQPWSKILAHSFVNDAWNYLGFG